MPAYSSIKHWLCLSSVFQHCNGLGPSHLSDLLLSYRPSRTMRSPGTGILSAPNITTKTHGDAAFSHDGSYRWNSLPECIRSAGTDDIFKRRPKLFWLYLCLLPFMFLIILELLPFLILHSAPRRDLCSSAHGSVVVGIHHAHRTGWDFASAGSALVSPDRSVFLCCRSFWQETTMPLCVDSRPLVGFPHRILSVYPVKDFGLHLWWKVLYK